MTQQEKDQFYPFNRYPCCKEKEQDMKDISNNRKTYIYVYIITSLLPSLCLIVFHDLIYSDPWNPYQFIIMMIPQLWGIPLLAVVKEKRGK